MAPVGEARGLVQPLACQLGHQRLVADGIAEAADHAGDLGVEQRGRDPVGLLDEDLDVLAGSVEDLQYLRIGHQLIERIQRKPVCHRVDGDGLVMGGHLH